MAKQALKINVGSGHLRSNFVFGKTENYTYNVPDGAISVSLSYEDVSNNALSIGAGSGDVTLKWTKGSDEAYVHAWVNGALGAPNEVTWTVYATLIV